MSFLALLLVVPPLALLASALIAGRPWASVGRWQWTAVLAGPIAAFAAAIALTAWLWAARGGAVRLVLSPWSATLFESGVVLRGDVLTGACLVLISALALGAAARGRASGDLPALSGPLLVSAGAALFVTAADEPLGFVFAWLALDLALLVGGGGGVRLWLLSAVGLAMGLAGIVNLPYPSAGSPPSLADATDLSRWWLLGAAAVRMGLYPLWWSLPPSTDRPWRALGTRLAPTVAGAYLVLLVAEPTRLMVGLGDNTLLPALLATAGGGLLAWLASGRGESLDWQVTFQAGLIATAVLIGGPIGRAIALVLTIDLVLTRSVLYAVEGLADNRVARWSRWTALAGVAALPPTLGFAGRWLLYRELMANQAYAALGVTALASAAATMSLVELTRARAPTGRTDRLAATVVAVPAVASVALGIGLAAAGPVLERLTGSFPVNPLADMWATLTNRLTLGLGLQMLLLIVLPVVLAVAVRRSPHLIVDSRRRAARRILALTPIVEGAGQTLVWAGEVVQRTTGLLESRRAMAWTVMATAVTGTAMVIGGVDPGAPAAAPMSGSIAPFLIAAVLATVLLLGPTPGGPIAALVGAYVLTAAVLAFSGAAAVLIAIKVLVGAIVTGIVVISVLQSPSSTPDRGLLHRLAEGPWRLGPADQPVVTALALLAALTLGFGAQATHLAPDLPGAAVRVGSTLVVTGVLATVFARDALRLAVAVLFALIGFELLYAYLDPGLVITGGLGAFQLMFAVVASYHFGLAHGTGSDAYR